jgi:hypothetical protein
LIGLTWRRTLKHTKSCSRWYNGDSAMARRYVDEKAMVRWWKHIGTNVKQRLYDSETTIVRWWNNEGSNNEGSMVKTCSYYGERRRLDDENVIVLWWKTMLRWWKYDGTVWWNWILVLTRWNIFRSYTELNKYPLFNKNDITLV